MDGGGWLRFLWLVTIMSEIGSSHTNGACSMACAQTDQALCLSPCRSLLANFSGMTGDGYSGNVESAFRMSEVVHFWGG